MIIFLLKVFTKRNKINRKQQYLNKYKRGSERELNKTDAFLYIMSGLYEWQWIMIKQEVDKLYLKLRSFKKDEEMRIKISKIWDEDFRKINIFGEKKNGIIPVIEK